ncbi:MAG: hypothetical protein P8188_13830, partial [Gemmatimonadota bacterium]
MRRRRAFFDLLTRRRTAVLLAYGLLMVASLAGLRQLRVDYSAEQFFLFDGQERADFEEFKRYFPREDLQVSAFLEVAGPLTVEDLHRLASVAEAFRAVGLHSVRWLGGVELIEEGTEEGTPLVRFIRLEDEPGLDDARLQELLEARQDHPVWSGVLWGRDQRVFAVHGFLEPGENTDVRRREVTQALQTRLEELTPGTGRLALNGLPVLRVTVPLALSSDLGRLLGLGILLTLVLVWSYFRRTGLSLLCL